MTDTLAQDIVEGRITHRRRSPEEEAALEAAFEKLCRDYYREVIPRMLTTDGGPAYTGPAVTPLRDEDPHAPDAHTFGG